MECHKFCENFFCKTHTSRISRANRTYMDALKAMMATYKSAGGRDTEATTLALQNYIYQYDVYIWTCNEVETKRQEAASSSNVVDQLGPFSPTPELNRALYELIDYKESEDARHGYEAQVTEDNTVFADLDDLAAPEKPVEDNTAGLMEQYMESVAQNGVGTHMTKKPAPEETMKHNIAAPVFVNLDDLAAPEKMVEDNTAGLIEEYLESNAQDGIGIHMTDEPAPEETVLKHNMTALGVLTSPVFIDLDDLRSSGKTVGEDTARLIEEYLESDAQDGVNGTHMTKEPASEERVKHNMAARGVLSPVFVDLDDLAAPEKKITVEDNMTAIIEEYLESDAQDGVGTRMTKKHKAAPGGVLSRVFIDLNDLPAPEKMVLDKHSWADGRSI